MTAAVAPAVRRRPTAGEHCPACGSARLTVIRMTLTDGSPVRFASCHDCEHRLWSQDGTGLALPTVLEKATRHR